MSTVSCALWFPFVKLSFLFECELESYAKGPARSDLSAFCPSAAGGVSGDRLTAALTFAPQAAQPAERCRNSL